MVVIRAHHEPDRYIVVCGYNGKLKGNANEMPKGRTMCPVCREKITRAIVEEV
jgi:hypothetical protein